MFSIGFRNAFDFGAVAPYATPVPYDTYILPGLIGMILLFNGMQNSLSMVYDREMGSMRLLMTAPWPRWYLLGCRLISGTLVSFFQVYAFLIIAAVFGFDVPLLGGLALVPVLLLSGLMLGALGMILAARIEQLENFAGVMNFVIFPMFFASFRALPPQSIGRLKFCPGSHCGGKSTHLGNRTNAFHPLFLDELDRPWCNPGFYRAFYRCRGSWLSAEISGFGTLISGCDTAFA